MIRIEVVHALPGRALQATYALGAGATLADALKSAAEDPLFAGVDVAGSACGIYGQIAGPDTRLRDGDRVEIYRPLKEDPKAARRRRVSRSGAS